MRDRLFQRLEAGLKEGIEFSRGESILQTIEVAVAAPPPAYNGAKIIDLRE